MAERDLSSYIEVATRIADFRKEYPEGSLRPWNPAEPWRLVQAQGFDKDGSVTQQTFIVVVAAAYRHGLDDNPGVGMAWEIFPGRTPYTRGSELQNAETSAWGRAIIAVGASDSKAGIASREEVAARRAEREEPVRGYEPCGAVGPAGFGCGLPKGHDQQPGPAGLHGWEAGALPRNRDGSTSRSRVTDEQLEQTGQMTKAQQAAHNKLEREVKGTGPQGATRLSGPVDDLWEGTPGHWAEGALPPEDQPGSSTPQQRQHLALKLAEIGLPTPEQGRAWCTERVGREIATRKDLSLKEGRMLLDEVDKVIDANRKAAKT